MAASSDNIDNDRTRDPGIVRRLQVIVPCLVLGIVVSFMFGSRCGIELCLWPLAGPFAEPMAFVDYSWPRMLLYAAIVLPLMAAHPIWPNALTAGITILATGWWFLTGLGCTYAGV